VKAFDHLVSIVVLFEPQSKKLEIKEGLPEAKYPACGSTGFCTAPFLSVYECASNLGTGVPATVISEIGATAWIV
jgi:hypothetical protein